ncbi:MAG TPA: glycosyltransferase family 4 protein [Candidatus Sericytochromatia bacterium]
MKRKASLWLQPGEYVKIIVFVNPVGAIGGAERVLLTLFAALRNTQPNIQLHLIVGTDGLLVASAQELGVRVRILKLPDQVLQLGDSALKGNNQLRAGLMLLVRIAIALPAFMQYVVKFQKTIGEINPDLIHTNGIKSHLLTRLPGSKRVPVVWHIHDFYSSRPLMARVLRWASDRATGGIAISEAVAQDAIVTLPGLPIEVIYNALDVNHFSPGFSNLNRLDSPFNKLTSPVGIIRVGLVATFARWKGHDIFLKAADQVIRDRPELNVHFYIVGGAIYQTQGSQFSESELRELAAVLQIEDNVDFIGFQQNIVDVYRWLDIVVHASTQPEPFGLAIIEAMACGKPVIVSQAGGAAELFTHNYDAVSFQPNSPTALASRIQHLIDNPCLCKRLSENARNTVLKRFSHDRLGEQILTVYKKFNALD